MWEIMIVVIELLMEVRMNELGLSLLHLIMDILVSIIRLISFLDMGMLMVKFMLLVLSIGKLMFLSVYLKLKAILSLKTFLLERDLILVLLNLKNEKIPVLRDFFLL